MAVRLVTFGLSTVILLSFVAAQPRAQAPAKVTIVTKDGKSIALPYVAATRYVAASGEAEIRLLFASADPKGIALADPFGEDTAVGRWLMERKVPAVKVTFKEGDEVNFQANTYNVGEFNYSGGGHASGGETRGVFRKLNLEKDRIAGDVKYELGSSAFAGNFTSALTTVNEAPAIKGPKVAASPQAEVLIAFARAMGKMDFAAAQQYAADDVQASMKEAREFMGEAGLKKMIKERFGDPKVLQTILNSPDVALAEAGDRAKISLTKKTKDKDGESSTTESFTFVKVDNKWKMTM